MKLGFIGLGNIGGVMARRLVKAGHALVVHDLDTKAVASLTAMGAIAASSARDVPESERSRSPPRPPSATSAPAPQPLPHGPYFRYFFPVLNRG